MQHKKQQFKGGQRSGRGGGRRNNKTGNRGKKAYINPEKFVNKNVVIKEEKPQFDESVKFADFNFVSQIDQNLEKTGFVHPSEIQKLAIPVALTGRDVIGLANTGTGKTIAFLLPIINAMLNQKSVNSEVLDLTSGAKPAKKRFKSALILAPTRELAQQINEEFKKFGAKTGLHSALLVGGVNIGGQFRDLRRRPQIIIGTPEEKSKLRIVSGDPAFINYASWSAITIESVDWYTTLKQDAANSLFSGFNKINYINS